MWDSRLLGGIGAIFMEFSGIGWDMAGWGRVSGRWAGGALGLLLGHSVALFVFAAEAGEGEGVGFDAVAGAAEEGAVV